jgi:hypothetical protein
MTRMNHFTSVALVMLSAVVAASQSNREPQWIPPLVEGGTPDCPRNTGLRETRSAVAVSAHGKTSAYIAASARCTIDHSCRRDATLILTESGKHQEIKLQSVAQTKTEAQKNDLDAPNPMRSYSVIDFSPDDRLILLQRVGTDSWRNDTYRDVDIAVLDATATGQPKWINTWDLMHWTDCHATVETQGFDKTGQPVLRVRPSVWHQHEKHDCVAYPELWAVDLRRNSTTQLPDETPLSRAGKTTGADWVTCENDPDIVAACFTVYGRLSVYNGGPSLRIWRVGTSRILGVTTETAPENVSRLWKSDPFNTEIYGDFEVCPFTKDKAGEMQMVCIESASRLLAKQR